MANVTYNKYFKKPSVGGVSVCLEICPENGSTLPNCVGWAWGRFVQWNGGVCPPWLCALNAGDWIGYVRNHGGSNYLSLNPAPGAVLCFASTTGKAGHVAFVESVNPDGSINTTESGYSFSPMTLEQWTAKTKHFTNVRRPPTYVNGSENYRFQGFIRNPSTGPADDANTFSIDLSELIGDDVTGGAELFGHWERVSNKERFIEAATTHVGNTKQWVLDTTHVGNNQAWSGAFVVACAKQAGVLNIVIPDTFSATQIGRAGYLREMGSWIPGPAQGKSAYAQNGDVVLFRNKTTKSVNTYYSDYCGVVVEANGSSITVVQGDTNGGVTQKSYAANNSLINGYYRPKWDLVDEGISDVSNYDTVQGLYTQEVSHRDAAVKEIGYIDSNMKPSIQTSDVKLSLLNYTGLLSNMYSVFGGALAAVTDATTSDQAEFDTFVWVPGFMDGIEDVDVDVSPVTGNAGVAIRFFLTKGLNAAAACAIAANIKHESGFRCDAVGDNGTSFGICQWHLGRGENMKNYCGGGNLWKANFTGQLNFLWNELTGGYKRLVLDPMMSNPNNLTGLYDDIVAFVEHFEIPADFAGAEKTRYASALDYWNSIIRQR